jgi:3-methyladenine DNA glycosylase AlkD
MDLRKELRRKIEPGKAEVLSGFFKERPLFLGVTAPNTRAIAWNYYAADRKRSQKEVYNTVAGLMKCRYHEEKNLGLFILEYYNNEFNVLPFCEKHLGWFDKWDFVDVLAIRIIGDKFIKDRRLLAKFRKWARSGNLWIRRLAVVSTLRFMKKKSDIGPTMQICEMLADDREIMVQKGYAWALKEAATIDLNRVVKFLKKHNSPRLVVNIAKEKMPEKVKKRL